MTYNPLDLSNLADQMRRAVESQPIVGLGRLEEFPGAGLYALYYTGSFPLYSGLAAGPRATMPIYVGKAVTAAARKGAGVTAEVSAPILFKRIAKHRESILAAASTLDESSFQVRYLITQPVWVPLGEVALIARYRPLWNVVIDGFGNNDPGGRRREQYRSAWDHLHPGRKWASKQASNPGFNRKELGVRIAKHLRETLVGQQLQPPFG